MEFGRCIYKKIQHKKYFSLLSLDNAYITVTGLV